MSNYLPEQVKQFLKMIAFILFFVAILAFLAHINGCATLKNLSDSDAETRICQTVCGITATMPEACSEDIPDVLTMMSRAPNLVQCVAACDGLPEIDYRCISRLFMRPPKETTCEDLVKCL
jgi:hypothetical protein